MPAMRDDSAPGGARRAFAPGRVNLIGEYTDIADGLALPMAVQLGTTVEFEVGGDRIALTSADEPEPAVVRLDVGDPAGVTPDWARYIAGVVAEVRPSTGGRGTVSTTLPIGAGLSSSAALGVSVALALGFEGSALELARACQRGEQKASGLPCGIMDQLTSAGGIAGHALLIDFRTESFTPVLLPDGIEVVAVHSGQSRALIESGYADRRAECERAAATIGPLRDATLADVATIDDQVVRRRAHHVVSENSRTLAFVAALAGEELASAGEILAESHASLRDDFEVSTLTLDALVERLQGTPGVIGARLTGGGFGGCAVALCEPGALDEGWRLQPSDGARLLEAA